MNELTGFTTATLQADDGTVIGYRQIGQGAGLLMVHGGMQSSLSFTILARALSADFTVYVVDRRGRGLSGAYGESDDRLTEANDLLALIKTKAISYIFGLSSGAILTLQAALLEPSIQKIALYEPPIPLQQPWYKKLNSSYSGAMSEANLGRAFAAILKGTGDTSWFTRLPYVVLTPAFNLMMKGETTVRNLVPTFAHDLIILQGSEQLVEQSQNLSAEVLLMQGAQSQRFLTAIIAHLKKVLPQARLVTFKRQGHLAADNSGDPVQVAAELKRFFS
ncbi:alpha/beta fold hydrolase [Mucilaginibacter ximonensis]|uniref:Alpha/beta fold hydrolase n=1 Tax=Mucilaginibacter ximonensis TaxID=538021 RepID=A0ABW5Y9M9_9SPHI